MRFLADENVERAIVEAVRGLGHDVAEVGQLDPGVDDEGVVRLARRGKRVLLTNDKDFGELVFLQHRQLRAVVLIRLPGMSGTGKAPLVAAALRGAASTLSGRFLVVEPNRVRSRPMRRE